MRSKLVLSLAVGLFSVALAACGGSAPANSNSTANAVKGNTNNPLETTKKASEETVNKAPTLTPVYKAYCEAMMKKDEAAIRKIYSSDTIQFFEKQMKEEKIKSLIKYLEDDKFSGKVCEVRNETIVGDKAMAEIRSDSYPNGIKIEFVKEGGEWKMTNKSPALDMKQSANSNSAQ